MPSDQTSPSAAQSLPSARLLSLDVFRGITIAAMVIVNNPGSWSNVYPPLLHAEWHGLTPTDLVFPFFVFIVGVCVPLSLKKYLPGAADAEAPRGSVYGRIVRRSALIFFISLIVLHGFPFTAEAFRNIRIPGVLQRIALCYLFTACIYLNLRVRGQSLVMAGLLIGYWLLMTLVPAPGFEAGDLSKEGSLASWIDRTLLAGHIYKPEYDPEGLLSTLPAIASCLTGLLAGQWLLTSRERLDKASGLFGFGILSALAGLLWSLTFPINKPLWTSSYVLVTTGLALLLLGLCYWLIDIKSKVAWSKPFQILGVNALAIFVLTGIAGDVMGYFQVAAGGDKTVSIKTWMYDSLFSQWLAPKNASLAWAMSYLLVWFVVAVVLYRRRILLRV